MDLIFEKSIAGRRGYQLPKSDVPAAADIPAPYARRSPAPLPDVSELDVVRHFSNLSRLNYSLDSHCYPLGSCTMKYNPRICEQIAALPGFSGMHPLLAQLPQGESLAQGALEVLYGMDRLLAELTGMDCFTLQPLAGAHGELTGVMMMAAYHRARGNKKKYVFVPDSAHGTNPSSAAIAGYETISIPTDKDGVMDIAALKQRMSSQVAGLMVTCPNTLGIFESRIDQVAEIIHAADGLMYYDGANLNSILGRCRPGDLGFDIMHINLHKTFSTPHGGGGPGAGPVGVKKRIERFLPVSRVVKKADGMFALNYDYPESIGYIASFYGNFSVILKAYAYIMLLGKEGLRQVSDFAVLNANYVMHALKDKYQRPFERTCMHECVFSASRQAACGVHAIDIAKFLIDQGMHPPTVYFPLIVKETIMVEPTETESKQTLDRFIAAMRAADDLAKADPGVFKDFPRTTPVSRPDEVRAARELNTNFFQPIPCRPGYPTRT